MWSRFEGRIEQTSSKAILFQSHYWDAPLWFPMSQIRIFPDGEFFHVIDVRDWLTDKRNILEFTPYAAEQIEAINGQN
jgi:hypothetical protein